MPSPTPNIKICADNVGVGFLHDPLMFVEASKKSHSE